MTSVGRTHLLAVQRGAVLNMAASSPTDLRGTRRRAITGQKGYCKNRKYSGALCSRGQQKGVLFFSCGVKRSWIWPNCLPAGAKHSWVHDRHGRRAVRRLGGGLVGIGPKPGSRLLTTVTRENRATGIKSCCLGARGRLAQPCQDCPLGLKNLGLLPNSSAKFLTFLSQRPLFQEYL